MPVVMLGLLYLAAKGLQMMQHVAIIVAVALDDCDIAIFPYYIVVSYLLCRLWHWDHLPLMPRTQGSIVIYYKVTRVDVRVRSKGEVRDN